MRRDAKERSVITTRIETAHIKIPMIVGQNQHIGFYQLSLTPAKTMKQPFVRCQPGRVYIRPRRSELGELFVQSDKPVRVLRLVHRMQPLSVRVPVIYPTQAIVQRYVKPWIFQHPQWKTLLQLSQIETDYALLILCEMGDGHVAQLQLTLSFSPSQ